MINVQQVNRHRYSSNNRGIADDMPFVEPPLQVGDIVTHPLMNHRYRVLLITRDIRDCEGVFQRVKSNGDIDRRCAAFTDYLFGYSRW